MKLDCPEHAQASVQHQCSCIYNNIVYDFDNIAFIIIFLFE